MTTIKLLGTAKKLVAGTFAFALLAALPVTGTFVQAAEPVHEHHYVYFDSDFDMDDTASDVHTRIDYMICEDEDCDDMITTETQEAHNFRWETNEDGAYFYCCKDCGYTTGEYSWDQEFDEETDDAIALEVGSKETIDLGCTDHDKVEAVKVVDGAKFVKVKYNANKGDFFTVQGKKAGTSTITVTYKSGAEKTFVFEVE